MKVVSKQRNSRMCYVCGMDNPVGLKAPFYNMEDGSVMTLFRFEEEGEDGKGKLIGKLCRKGELYYEDKLKAAGLS